MRLTHLDVFGFKSFYNKTEIPFDTGITGIVGPNGCGKSNIVEAIRWVLGEQRATAVRGHRMEDVIFAGTRSNKPLGMAEVSLTIDNAEHILPIDYTEITVTRRLFRSGESDYLLNKVPCRLLDIQNLLMDTGLGPGAYSVMEQGMVDEIISEKTENRRRILEEAAGITKYKARRRSTWNKLESTQADLTRLEDIISEVKRQVDYLSRQVGRARRFQALKTELDELELLVGRHKYFCIQTEISPLQREFEELNRSSEAGFTQFTAREAELEKRRLAVTETEGSLQEAGVALSRCVEEIHERDNLLVSSRERREAREHFIERASREGEELRAQLEEGRRQHTETQAALAEATEEVDRSGTRLQEQERITSEADGAYNSSRSGLDAENHYLRDLLREKGDRSSALASLRAKRESLQQTVQQQRAEIESSRADLEVLHQQALGTDTEVEQLRQRLAGVDSDLASARERRQQTGSSLEKLAQREAGLLREIESGKARIQVLERVRSNFEGYSAGVRKLLVDSPFAQLFEGVLGDLIDVDPDCVRAVESALGDAVEALIAHSDREIVDAIASLEGGRAGVLPLQWQQALPPPVFDLDGDPGVRGALSSFVRVDSTFAPILYRLLHNTFLVDDLRVALRLARQRADVAVRLVTPAGEGVDTSRGLISGGESGDADQSVLARGREIRDLRAVISRQRGSLSAVSMAIAAEQSRCGVLDGYLSDLEELAGELRDQEREASLHQRAAGESARVLEERIDRLGHHSQELEDHSRELDGSSRGEEQRLAQIEKDSADLEQRLQAREERVREAEHLRQERREALNTMRVESARVAEKKESMRRDDERLAVLVTGHEETICRLEKEMAQASEDRQKLENSERSIGSELEDKHRGREQLASARDKRQHEWQYAMARSRELEEEISRLQRELSGQRERRHHLELRITELNGEASRISERLTEEYQTDVNSIGPLSKEELIDFDGETSEHRLGEVRRGIARLGTVHVGVLEEFEQQRERYDFLVEHRDDLQAAAEDLRKTLQHIDRVARRMFRETFEKIREKFRETYGRFFPGGEADLKLEEDVDPLESSIEISARPRGKRLQSIGLLSGGEKALTAIAMLFAIYQVKPSPWCILDEVDAPLDDANIERFLRVLREFARSTQFIMVTHNKLSMGAADTLHGVTMPEEGVSQLVSVQVAARQLDEAAG
ncbi:MAG: chromosome segregation protein SMC [Candidatus Latescibacterota bacterium]|nr:chromosome segregation protein SMC [Candidatus Latescibacterota bacterium]